MTDDLDRADDGKQQHPVAVQVGAAPANHELDGAFRSLDMWRRCTLPSVCIEHLGRADHLVPKVSREVPRGPKIDLLPAEQLR